MGKYKSLEKESIKQVPGIRQEPNKKESGILTWAIQLLSLKVLHLAADMRLWLESEM